MMWVYILVFLLTGCVPVYELRKEQRYSSSLRNERDSLAKDLVDCKASKEKVESIEKPAKVIKIYVPVRDLDDEQLKAIRKQAFEEAERTFKLRMKRTE